MQIKFFSIIIVSIFCSCATNPFTGKKTFALVPNSKIIPYHFQNTINLSMRIKLLMIHMSQNK
jgi:hypothetical protein